MQMSMSVHWGLICVSRTAVTLWEATPVAVIQDTCSTVMDGTAMVCVLDISDLWMSLIFFLQITMNVAQVQPIPASRSVLTP